MTQCRSNVVTDAAAGQTKKQVRRTNVTVNLAQADTAYKHGWKHKLDGSCLLTKSLALTNNETKVICNLQLHTSH